MDLTLYERLGGREGILRLIRPFYIDVRQHAVLGRIFNSRIDDWPAHLAHITDFWARQTGGPSTYVGGFASAHLPIGIQREHLKLWLELWDFNCRRHLAAPEAADMSALAHRVGEQLQRILGGRSGLSVDS